MEQPSHESNYRKEEEGTPSTTPLGARKSGLRTLKYILLAILLCMLVVVILALLGPSVSNDSGVIINSI